MPSRKARPQEPADPRQHPEYALESEHLSLTVRTLDALVDALQNPESGAADEWTASVLAGFAEEQVWQLVEARPSPYQGRLDFVPADSGVGGAFYIGKVGFAGADQKQVVTDWRAPIASLYYRGRPGATSSPSMTACLSFCNASDIRISFAKSVLWCSNLEHRRAINPV